MVFQQVSIDLKRKSRYNCTRRCIKDRHDIDHIPGSSGIFNYI